MKICILNFATRTNKTYMMGQRRLMSSLEKVEFKGDVFTWTSEKQFNCPNHKDIPYAFKPYALKWARENGYDLALWLDASFWAIKNIDPVFNIIEKEGHLMQNDGNRLGNWCHDNALEKYSINRDEAMSIKMFSAGCTGLNFHNDRSNQFLDMWLEAANDGFSFQGPHKYKPHEVRDKRVVGHRHDMSIGTILAHKLDMKYQKAWSIFTYGRNLDYPDVYFICKGM